MNASMFVHTDVLKYKGHINTHLFAHFNCTAHV